MAIPLILLSLGIFVENLRISSSKADIVVKIILAVLFSGVLNFFPNLTGGEYVWADKFEFWPYVFIGCYVFFSVLPSSDEEIEEGQMLSKSTVSQLTEGITLLQSVAIIYWVIDFGLDYVLANFGYLLLGLAGLFCLLSFYQAFSYSELSKKIRFALSIWSAIVMIIFGIDHIVRVFSFDLPVDMSNFDFFVFLFEFFLLGVSLVYILTNVMMLAVYLPGRGRYYGKEHMDDIKGMNKTHIDRYSEGQISIMNALFAVAFSAALYYGNYIYQLMPSHTIIWLLFWIFPYLIWAKGKLSPSLIL